ncbi:LuxR C-terminal-related transcriptional regulator [Aurantiacibacter sp. MUD11]|uniref:LuxR C-terminal-related transcriptional regulator n=1 Tax=Aurantiacibacter sp. MUD11 TaxID=3003265 RepID=UPI0022AA8F70|nr:LuxR C-terminal-related transcriptional regulator [Aurantiacibacter sp. MUD11]WAT17935.1 LuxR C-terminal-related transcriptional regulator [Aurantiacibacter sp. MUD11]
MAETLDTPLGAVFDNLTEKQRETLELLADGRTSKEIAHLLGVSESAIIQRIESLRAKTGGMLRKDLAREYRRFLDERPEEAATYNEITGNNFHLHFANADADKRSRHLPESEMRLSDSLQMSGEHFWADDLQPRVVPEVLDGKHAGLNRWLAAAGLAVAISIAMLVLLSVAGELSRLF